jgi:CheY-like chemotaxis protein
MRSIFAPFCGVVEARDGQEALDMCKTSVPNLIITDVMMPIVCRPQPSNVRDSS